MTPRKRDPYGQRLTDLDNWLLLPDNIAQITTAAAGIIAVDRCASVLRLLVSKTNKISGTVDQTYQQISDATQLSADQVKRAVTVLTNIGVLITVTGSRSGGAGGAAGRAPVRRIAFLSPVDNLGMAVQSQPNGSAVDRNGGAVSCTPLRIIPTEINPTHEKTIGDFETDQTDQRAAQSMSQQSEQVISAVADLLYSKAIRSGLQLTSPDGFKRTQRSKALKAFNRAEQRFGAGLRMISTTQYEYQSVLEWCAAVASDENPSPASYQLIEQACSELISAN
jgi:hypothetical protein